MNERFIKEMIVSCDGFRIRLEYYLIEEALNEYCPEIKRYGVSVKMTRLYEESYETGGEKRIRALFCGEKEALAFIDILAKNTVTPVTLREITEEYILGKIQIEDKL